MQDILNQLHKITSWGIKKKTSSQDARRILLTNQICAIIIALSSIYGVIFVGLKLYFLAILVPPVVGLFSLSLILNKYHHPTLSKLFLISAICFALIIYSSALGKESGLNLLFLVLVTISTAAFDLKTQKKEIVSGSLIAMGSWVYLELTRYSPLGIQPIPLNTFTQTAIYITSCSLIICINFMAIIMYHKANQTSEEALSKAHQEVQKLYEEAKKRRYMLEKASQQKAFATLSQGIAHLIRNPMGMILTSIELLADNSHDPVKVGRYCETTKENLMRLTRITNNMIKYGEAGFIHDIGFNDLNAAIQSAIDIAKAECTHHQITVQFNPSKLQPISFDPNMLPQVFFDIIVNSIEAIGSRGSISISTQYESYKTIDGDNRNGVKISIQDTGCGILPEHKAFIFDPYYTTKYGHSGLGLNIALKIIDAHDGNILVKSVPGGKGVITEIYLPLTPSKKIQIYQTKRNNDGASIE